MRVRLATMAAVLLAACCIATTACSTQPPDLAARWPAASSEPTVTMPADLQRWPLTGKPSADKSGNHPRVVAVALAGSGAGATGPSGAGAADVVYEMQQGNAATILALYQSRASAKVGPVRPARAADVDIVTQYSALYAHQGGGADVLAALSAAHVSDLDASANRAAFPPGGPGSTQLFASTAALRAAAARRKYAANADGRPFEFGPLPAGAVTSGTAVASVVVPVVAAAPVTWTWNAGARSWTRSVGGAAQVDPATGAPIGVANVVVLWDLGAAAPSAGASGPPDAAAAEPDLTGQGRATLFRDGTRVNGRWEATADGPPVIRTSAGAVVPFAAGSTWFLVIPNDRDITMR